jgi:LacI family transcriptional regulator
MTLKAITLHDIAQRLNVSSVTVSKALRNHPDISDRTKKIIKQLAEELGYTPNIMARNLSARKSNTIGVVVPKIAHFFFSSIIEHIYNYAFASNYEIILTVSQENAQREKEHIRTLMAMKVDGIIISITQETKDIEIFNLVKKRGLPLVFMDRIPEMEAINSVRVDDFAGSYNAINHCIKLGYKKIGHFAGYTNINIGRDRKLGFIKAMQDNGIEVNPDWVIEGSYGENAGYEFFMKLFKENNLPDMLFAVTYPVALGVYMGAAEVGIRIPEDLDIICFGDATEQRFLSPPLSSVNQPTDQIAVKSLRLLMDNIDNKENFEPQQVLIDTNLIFRSTCIRFNHG